MKSCTHAIDDIQHLCCVVNTYGIEANYIYDILVTSEGVQRTKPSSCDIPITPTKTTIILRHRRCTLLANKVLIATIFVCGIANTENNKSKPTPFQPWCHVLVVVGKFIPLIICSLTKLTAFIYIVWPQRTNCQESTSITSTFL